MTVSVRLLVLTLAALAAGAIACSRESKSPEELAATEKLNEFVEECEASCPMDGCEEFCDCTVAAYREKFENDVAVVNFMNQVDATHQSGDILGAQNQVLEFFEACEHLVVR